MIVRYTIFAIFLILFTSCSIQKRIYRGGLYVENVWSKNKYDQKIESDKMIAHKDNEIKEHQNKSCIPDDNVLTTNLFIPNNNTYSHYDEIRSGRYLKSGNKNTYPKKQQLCLVKEITKRHNKIEFLDKITMIDSMKAKVSFSDTMSIKKEYRNKIIRNIVFSSVFSFYTIAIYYYHFFYTLLWIPLAVWFFSFLFNVVAVVELIVMLFFLKKIKGNKKWIKYAWFVIILDILSLIFWLIPIIIINYKYII